MTRTCRAIFGRVGEFNARIEENVGGMRVVQAFANEDHERHLFAATTRVTAPPSWRPTASSPGAVAALPQHAVRPVVRAAQRGLVHLPRRAEHGRVIISYILLTGTSSSGRCEKINAVIDTYPKGIAGFKRYLEVMDTNLRWPTGPARSRWSDCGARSATADVTFGYDPQRPVLQNMDTRTIRSGETVAFVGLSGAGKTTSVAAAALLRYPRGADHHGRHDLAR